MRIALYHNLPSGGALRFVRELVRRSVTEHEYDVYRIADADRPDDRLTGAATAVYDVEPERRWTVLTRHTWPTRRLAALRELWSAEAEIAARIDAGRYDLCLVNGCRVTQSPRLLKKLRTPTLYYAQEPRRLSVETAYAAAFRSAGPMYVRAVDSAFEQLLRRRDRQAVGAATELACNSLFTAESLYRTYGRDATVVRLGVDTRVFKPNGAKREDYVLTVGALDPTKGHATVIEALASLPPSLRPGLRIVYERCMPAYDDTLRVLADRHGVCLQLHRGVSDEDLAALYSAARATVCAARLEPFGLTALESLSCGTPVVAVNEGGFRESVADGFTGVLVPPTSVGLAQGISEVLMGRITADSTSLRESVHSRTWDSTVDALHRLYRVVARR